MFETPTAEARSKLYVALHKHGWLKHLTENFGSYLLYWWFKNRPHVIDVLHAHAH